MIENSLTFLMGCHKQRSTNGKSIRVHRGCRGMHI